MKEMCQTLEIESHFFLLSNKFNEINGFQGKKKSFFRTRKR